MSHAWLTREELGDLAGPQPDDPAWLRKMQRAYAQWGVLRDALSASPGDRKSIQGEIGHAIGHHERVWKVRGITRNALEMILGRGNISNHGERKGFTRAHLHTWAGLLDTLVDCDRETTFEEWSSLIWDLDVTVICASLDENHMLDSTKYPAEECMKFFSESVITFANAENRFSDTGSTFKCRKGIEMKFLEGLYSQAQ